MIPFLGLKENSDMKTPLSCSLENLPPKLLAAIESELSQSRLSKIHKNRTRPLYQMACQAIDNIAPNLELTAHELLKFLETDTLLYVSPTDPALYQRQQEIWFPIHLWLQAHLDIIIPLSETIAPPSLCEATLIRVKTYLNTQSIFALAGIQAATHIAHSLIVAIMMREAAIDAHNAFTACLLEEITQNAKWGKEELAQARQDQVLEDLGVIEDYFCTIR
jgi:chaperone required for assembly of F1-ATPase